MKRVILRSLAIVLGACAAGCIGDPNSSEEDQTVIRSALDAEKFSSWQPIPNTNSGKPGAAVISRWPNTRDIFVLDSSGYVKWKQTWQGTPTMLGGPVANGSRPAASKWLSLSGEIWISDHAAVAVRWTDNNIWVKILNSAANGSGGWTQFHQLPGGGPFTHSPAIAYHQQTPTSFAYLYVIARKSDQKYYWTRNRVDAGYNQGGWSAWSAIPNGLFAHGPGAVSYPGALWVVGSGLDLRLYEATYNGSWDGWYKIATSNFAANTQPALAAWPDGRAHVFVWNNGLSGVSQATWSPGWGWGAFEFLYRGDPGQEGEFIGWPAANSWGQDHVEVVGTFDAGYEEYFTIYDSEA